MRTLHEPGTHWQYNDVRVNQLSFAILQIWRRPLPQVLREHLMDPIGASPTWRWHGYENSWVTLDGQRMQSVSGGGHWGGGMWISSRDHARFGLLCLRQGRWGDRQILSEDWIKRSSTPTDIKPSYGYMNWFLNGKHETSATAPETSIFFFGAGANMVWLDPDHNLVAVVRWIEREHVDGFVERVLAAIAQTDQAAAEE
jgi:CubicO group peptidase (beta-lactamase class C family)